MKRRNFITTAAMATAGVMVMKDTVYGAKKSANEKLNILLVGSWGRGEAHFGSLSGENVVALCDINEDHLAFGAKKFPNAKTYVDWRKAIEQKDLDAVVCCTADHMHPFVANWAINRGLHIYCEKPMGNCVEEARVVRANYLKNKDKVATQLGTQRHAIDNFARIQEAIRDGAIGKLEMACAWGNRQIRRKGYPAGSGEPPANIHYDLWTGASPMHPYSSEYFKGGPGANCLQWNMFWDFGTGQVGDMGSHTMDLAWCALDADLPVTAEGEGEAFNPEVTPVELHMSWDIPKNDWRPDIRLHWYQGGMMPKSPWDGFLDLKKIDHGAMFKGSDGFLVASFDKRVIYPYGKAADMSYYKPREKDKMIPPLGHFQGEWIKAAKTDLKTTCNFDYSGKMTETMMLGMVAYRVGKKLEYDPVAGKVKNCEEANPLLSKKYRDGWVLNG
ncbi:MAG TPA: Gfo/Idh/MocA family oxidoreductase [Planctomycetota bacterium]|jgi:hypothetical protein